MNGGQLHLSLIHIYKINNLGDEITKKGLNFGANSGNPVHKNLGETVSVVGTGDKADTNYSSENIKTKINADGNIAVSYTHLRRWYEIRWR